MRRAYTKQYPAHANPIPTLNVATILTASLGERVSRFQAIVASSRNIIDSQVRSAPALASNRAGALDSPAAAESAVAPIAESLWDTRQRFCDTLDQIHSHVHSKPDRPLP